ncbi:MAG: hypothetical protein KBC95_01150 [Candidatus Peribacteraceae bacterium]|nr:hypothetical protein [Candidatus Peribacteraceae bacterium]
MNLSLLLGIHVLSLLLAAVVLFEYWRICRDRAALLVLLGHGERFRLTPVLLVAAYFLSMAALAAVSAWIFFLLPPT